MSVDLHRAADLHCHFGPDPYRERSVDAFEAARDAAAAGHRALVLKSHDVATASLAWAVDQAVDGVRVFGGICCDASIGGVNADAVEVALRLGARIVWLPTLTGRVDVVTGLGRKYGYSGPGLVVTDHDGELLPETRQVFDLVREHDAILATGHISADEHYAVARAFAGRGKVLVTHATEDLAGAKLSTRQCVELADLGAWIELCALTCIGKLATKSVADMVGTIRAVGPDRVTLGSDYGQLVNERPTRGLQTYADALYAAGVTAAEISRMVATNPCALLGLSP